MSWTRPSSVALAVALLLVTGVVRAARVRFVSEASEPFNRRVVAELTSVGFDVDETHDVDAPLPEGSVAVVHAKNEPAQVEVWLLEATGRAVLSVVIERDLVSSDAADSTKIAERLRALLQPLAEARPEPTATAPEPVPRRATGVVLPPVHDSLSERAPTVRGPQHLLLDAGGAVSTQPGGAAVSLVAGIHYTVANPWGVCAFVAFPILGSTVEEPDASADVAARLIGLGGAVDVLPKGPDLRFMVGAGAGVAWLTAKGQAVAPREGRNVETLTGLGFADAALAHRVLGDTWLVARGLLGIAVPKTDIEFSGSPVGSFGRPLVMTTLSIGYAL